MNKLHFLFGSGISKSAGLPDVNTLTKDLISNSIDLNTLNNPFGSREDILYYRKFLGWLSNYCVSLNMNNTYEDLFFITQSIEDTINLGKDGNFLSKNLIENYKFEFVKFLSEESLSIHNNDFDLCFSQFIYGVNWYIKEIIVRKLSISDQTNLEDIEKYIDILSKNDDYNYDIFTLNHDILLETILLKLSLKEILLNTGFGMNNSFSIKNFKDFPERFNIFKLHGSINWNRSKDNSGNDYIFEVKLFEDRIKSYDPSNKILIGTFNKFEAYSYGIFYDLFLEFRKSLSSTNLLFVCGYGFHDEGVNSIILEWMSKDRKNKLVIIHPNKYSLINHANVPVGWKWNEFIKEDRLIFKPKFFENIDWDDIAESLL